jgi:hypothetical protein
VGAWYGPEKTLGTIIGTTYDSARSLANELAKIRFTVRFILADEAHQTENPNVTIQAGCGVDPAKFKETFRLGGQVYTVNAGFVEPIKKIEMGNLGAEHYNLLQFIPMILQELNGLVDITKGIVTKKQRQSATEIGSILESAYTRMRQKVRNLEWALTRALVLIVEMQQQFYTTAREVSQRQGDTITWITVGSDRDLARASAMPARLPDEDDQNYQKRLGEWTEYLEMIQWLDNTPELYAEFDLSIQTNSTLPMDKQSLANLMLRLAEVQLTENSIVDDVAVLEQLQIPNRVEIKQRKEKARAAKMEAMAKMREPQQPGGALPGAAMMPTREPGAMTMPGNQEIPEEEEG